MKMSNKTYDVLKWFAMIVLPAIATLYFSLAGIWGFPYGEEVVASITAVNTFLGVAIGVSTKSYNKANTLVEIIDKYDDEEEVEETTDEETEDSVEETE